MTTPPPKLRRRKRTSRDAGIAPDLSELLGRRQRTDARAEEAAHVVPARRDHAAGERQGESNVELPEHAPERPGRDPELERRDRPAAARHARKLAHGRAGIVDVAEQVRERQRVELTVLEWQLLGIPVDEANSLCESCPVDALTTGGEHFVALVETDDRAAGAARELDRHRGGSRRHVEDRLGRGDRHARDEETAPARILAEREKARVSVVRRTERCEELARDGVRR